MRMSASPERLCSSLRATTDFRARPRTPENSGRSGRNVAAEMTPEMPGMVANSAPTSCTISSRSAGRTAESVGNRSTTSTGTSGPIAFSSQA